MNCNNVFERIIDCKNRFVICQGGTSAGKSFAILQLLALKAVKYKLLISIVSETLPHLKRGVLRDFISILKEENIYNEKHHNKTDNIFKINNSQVEFFSADNPDKLRGARRDILFINECNNVSYNTFEQLEVRTKQQIFLDFNPVSAFWVHDKVLTRDDVYFDKSTYKDNPYLEAEIIKTIEARRETDTNWWQVYGLGEIGTSEGIVYTNWQMTDTFPDNCKWVAWGLDFGFTNFKTALVKVGIKEGELFAEELIYEKALTNQDIAGRMQALELTSLAEIYADCSEPKSIMEIYQLGFRNIKPVLKGKDSILAGIQLLKNYKLNITKNSTNLIKELRNYRWQQTRDSDYINKPIDSWNDGLDALRYCVFMKCGKQVGEGGIRFA